MTSGRRSIAIASPPDKPKDRFSDSLLTKDAVREVVEKQRTTSMPPLSRLFGRSRESGGIDVVRCFSTTSRTASLVSRLSENLSFGLSGGLAMAMLRRPDVIYANTWPIFASGVAAVVALSRRIPIVVSVQDVYPESLFTLGRLRKESILARLLRFLDVRIANLASDVVVISRRLERIYSSDRGVPAERLHLIANWRGSEEPPGAGDAARARGGGGGGA